MRDDVYLKIMKMALVLSLTSTGYLFFFKDPEQEPGAVALLVASLAVTVFVSSALVLLWAKTRKTRRVVYYFPFAESMRQSLFVTIFAIGLLMLSLYDLFNVFDAALLAVTLLLSESFFRSKFKLGRDGQAVSGEQE